ncbi:hypothetical protein ACOYA6_23010, partial [Leclercia barmai]|uniref:hypothetical protein n=1 Tax=Leclercia barmai TaxID=2785629 RepID=UPI003BB86EBE
PAGVRRRPDGAQQRPWRSGARRLNRAAGQEPKGASALHFVIVQPVTLFWSGISKDEASIK